MLQSIVSESPVLDSVPVAPAMPTVEDTIREQITQWDNQIRHAQREKKRLQAQLQLLQGAG